MAVEWYEVRPGRATMVEFTDGDVKVLRAGTVFKEVSKNKSVLRLTNGKRPRLRKLSGAEVTYHGLEEGDPIVILDEAI